MNIDALSAQIRGVKGSEPADANASTAGDAAELVQWSANRLWRRVAHECEAMADHAYSAGLNIPEETALLVDEALAVFGRSPVRDLPPAHTLTRDGGDEQPEDKTARTQPTSVALLSKAHAALAMIIKPATPEAVLLLIEERRKHSAWYAFGPLPIVRQMLGLAILSLLMMLIVSLSSDINVQNMSKTLLQLQGLTLLKIEIFLLSAASLGSCFQNLQQINALISAGNYRPKTSEHILDALGDGSNLRDRALAAHLPPYQFSKRFYKYGRRQVRRCRTACTGLTWRIFRGCCARAS